MLSTESIAPAGAPTGRFPGLRLPAIRPTGARPPPLHCVLLRCKKECTAVRAHAPKEML